jgi:hypothetical protein
MPLLPCAYDIGTELRMVKLKYTLGRRVSKTPKGWSAHTSFWRLARSRTPFCAVVSYLIELVILLICHGQSGFSLAIAALDSAFIGNVGTSCLFYRCA